jgi:polysaccharide deacetylase family protein (PEP-CTERM system associated)
MSKLHLPKIKVPTVGVMSIDVEDWFQVQNLADSIPRSTWEYQESRVVTNMTRMLAMMQSSGARSTCFVLGWVAERFPQLVREISVAGHEIASHGYGHELVYRIGPKRFREDVRRSKGIIEDIIGKSVKGYRAPNFSITDWALEILLEEGHKYDSSCFPVAAHDRYGSLSNSPRGRSAYSPRPGIDEVCVSSLRIFGRDFPWGGGAWFRLFPYRLFDWGVKRILRSNRPFVFYIHPWEIDVGQPRVRCSSKFNQLRHYTNLGICGERWQRILDARKWVSIQDLLTEAEREEA